MTLCNCKCSCTAAAVIASVIMGVLAAFLQITAVITVTPVFLWVAAGVAAVYLGILLLRGGCCGGEGRPCACAALNFILKPYLDDAHKDGINAEQLIIGHGYEDEDLVYDPGPDF